MIDEQIIIRFNRFKKNTEYSDLDLKDVVFEEKELKDLVRLPIKGGGTPNTKTAKYWSNDFSLIDDDNFYGWRNIEKELFEKGEIEEFSKVITKEGYDSSPTWLVPKNSILIAIASASKGLIVINKKPMCTNQNILGVVPKSTISCKYIFLNLKTIYSTLEGKKEFGNLTKGSEEKRKIQIPKDLNEKYTSLKIQEALVCFIEKHQKWEVKQLALLESLIRRIEKMEQSVLPFFFDKDLLIQKRFSQYISTRDVLLNLTFNDFEFIDKKLGDEGVANFPAMTRATGGVDLKVDIYDKLPEVEKEDYAPLVSGTMENNQISGYIKKDRLTDKHLSEAKVVTWTRINPKVFFLQEEPVCTNDDSFVMEPTPEADYKYLQAVATLVLSKTDYGWTKKAGKNVIKNFEVPIPKPVGDYSSLELQKILIDFSGIITSHYSKLKSMLADLKIKIQTYVSTTIHKTFKEQI